MRTGFARATPVAAADRDTRPHKAQTALARVASCLLGLLLVLQVAGVVHPSVRSVVPADAKTIALAGLGAAIGQPVTLCEHGDPSRPDDPAHTGSCEHCIFCHSVAVGAASTPGVAIGIDRVARATDVERRRTDVALRHARLRGGATPRGPPLVD